MPSHHDSFCVLQRVERELQEKGPSQLLLSSPLPDGSTTAQFAQLGMAAVPGVSVSTATLVPGVQPLGLNIDLASQSLATQGMELKCEHLLQVSNLLYQSCGLCNSATKFLNFL